MQNPAMQQAMQAMLANPGAMESLANAAASSNPQLRQMMDADPRLRCAAYSGPHLVAGWCTRCGVREHAVHCRPPWVLARGMVKADPEGPADELDFRPFQNNGCGQYPRRKDGGIAHAYDPGEVGCLAGRQVLLISFDDIPQGSIQGCLQRAACTRMRTPQNAHQTAGSYKLMYTAHQWAQVNIDRKSAR